MVVVAVMDVRDPLEAGREAAPDLLLAGKALPPGIGASWGFEDAVLREVGHDRVQVVSVEGVQDLAYDLALAVVVHDHLPLLGRFRADANASGFSGVKEIDIGSRSRGRGTWRKSLSRNHAAREKARELGGSAEEKQPVPGMDWFAHATDSEGNKFSFWQPDDSAPMPQGG